MRTYQRSRGPFRERPYFTHEEIDRICVEALQKVELLPRSPEPIRIDRFIEKHFRVTPTYEDLGPGILGLTRFGRDGVQAVIVSQRLDDEGSQISERRIRSTLAHEGGHGLLHEYLFLLETGPLLFGDSTPAGPKILCRDEPYAVKESAYKGKWWEYQANRAIGSLLLPRSLVMMAVHPFMIPVGALGLIELDRQKRPQVIQSVAETFDVNPIGATIRIDELFPMADAVQQAL
jgi:hypothetical protein